MPRTAEQFLNTVHRRRLVAAVSDASALAIAIGSAVAAAACFAPAFAIPASVAVMIAVFFWRLYNRPGRFETAADLDARLTTHDLLTTALFPTPVSDPGFARQVIAAADARFATVDPAPLAAGRVGIRGWSLAGLALAAAAVLVLRPRPDSTRPAGAPASGLLIATARTALDQSATQSAGPSGPRGNRPIDEPDTSKIGQAETAMPAGTEPDRGPGNARNIEESVGVGGGPGRSQTPLASEKRLDSAGNAVSPTGTETGDGRSPAADDAHGVSIAGAGPGGNAPSVARNPWQSANRPTAHAAATAAVADGVVPVRSRQLVRDYFDGE